jgi:hypothetical protein
MNQESLEGHIASKCDDCRCVRASVGTNEYHHCMTCRNYDHFILKPVRIVPIDKKEE